MKLGSETGSVINHLHSRATRGQPQPEIGMGVTFLRWTDRDPGTIQDIFTNGKFLYIGVTGDDARRTDNNGMSESQTYDYKPRPDAPRSYFRRPVDDPDAPFQQVRRSVKGPRWVKVKGGDGLRIGVREKYHDFSF